MFDPHRTRRSDSRYYTRKGQVLQASLVNTNPVIDQRLVPIYKNYILKNGIIPPPPQPLPIKGIRILDIIPIKNYNLSVMNKSTDPTVNINLIFPDQQYRMFVCIWQDKSGNHNLKTYLFQGTAAETIQNNVKCYYAAFASPKENLTPDEYESLHKGLIIDDDKDDKLLVTMNQHSLSMMPNILISI